MELVAGLIVVTRIMDLPVSDVRTVATSIPWPSPANVGTSAHRVTRRGSWNSENGSARKKPLDFFLWGGYIILSRTHQRALKGGETKAWKEVRNEGEE